MIYPIVISNSNDRNTIPIALDELFDYQEVAKTIIDFKYKLVDLIKTPEEEFNHEVWSDFLELGLKYKRQFGLKDSINKLKEKIEFFAETTEGIDYITAFLCYNIYDIEEQDLQEAGNALKQILGKTGENIMGSAARKLISEGFEMGKYEGFEMGKYEGFEMGRHEGELNKAIQTAKNMLIDGVQISTISKYTGLSIAEVNKIKASMGL